MLKIIANKTIRVQSQTKQFKTSTKARNGLRLIINLTFWFLSCIVFNHTLGGGGRGEKEEKEG